MVAHENVWQRLAGFRGSSRGLLLGLCVTWMGACSGKTYENTWDDDEDRGLGGQLEDSGGSAQGGSEQGDGGAALGGDPASGGKGGSGGSTPGNAAGGSSGGGEFSGGGPNGSGGAPDAGTGGSSPTHRVCGSGTYDTDRTDDELTCEPYSVCQPGTYIAAIGSVIKDQDCQPCPQGSYSTEANQFSCWTTTRCILGEDETVAATPQNDRECGPAEKFPLQTDDYERARTGGLVVNDEGAYVLFRGWDAEFESLLYYSLDGSVVEETPLQMRATDMTGLEDELFIVGSTFEVDSTTQVLNQPGVLQRRNKEGEVVWETRFEDETLRQLYAAKIAADSDGVVVVARVNQQSCSSDEVGGWQCVGSNPPGELIFARFEENGDLDFSVVLEEDTKVSTIFDVEVASDGRIYVALARGPLGFAVSRTSVLELDGTGDVISTHDYANELFAYDAALSADTDGAVYALIPFEVASNPDEHRLVLNRFAQDGQTLLDVDLDWDAHRIAAIQDGILLAGSTDEGEPRLVHVDSDARVVSSDVWEDVGGFYRFWDMAVAEDGRVFVSAESWSSAVVTPWPN